MFFSGKKKKEKEDAEKRELQRKQREDEELRRQQEEEARRVELEKRALEERQAKLSSEEKTVYRLSIVKVVLKHLKNVEMMGENDPFVCFEFGKEFSAKTSEQRDAGENAEWNTTGIASEG